METAPWPRIIIYIIIYMKEMAQLTDIILYTETVPWLRIIIYEGKGLSNRYNYYENIIYLKNTTPKWD